MADVQKVMEYLGNYCRFTTLPGYEDLDRGMLVDKDKCIGIETKFITPYRAPDKRKEEKLTMVKRIAAHLWGGNEEIQRVFDTIKIVDWRKYIHTRSSPLRIKVSFNDAFEKTFYAKPLDDKRLFGLELENLLSSYKYPYSASGGGIYEDEIQGIEKGSVDKQTEKDPLYLEELLRLNWRCFAFLLGDIGGPNNALVTRNEAGDHYAYTLRPIDFDRLFDLGKSYQDFKDSFILDEKEQEQVRKIIGNQRCDIINSFERESMRKRFCEYAQRIQALLDLMEGSGACNENLGSLSKCLAENYPHSSKRFLEARTASELLRMHLHEQLSL